LGLTGGGCDREEVRESKEVGVCEGKAKGRKAMDISAMSAKP